jgi:hypothetical protein
MWKWQKKRLKLEILEDVGMIEKEEEEEEGMDEEVNENEGEKRKMTAETKKKFQRLWGRR